VPTVDGGRIPGLEILINTGRIAERIADPDMTAEIKEVIAEGGYYGMVTFDQYLLELVKKGTVTIEAAMKAVSSQHDFSLALQQAGMTIPA
jgi:twitching motility protein PilT